MTQKLKLNHFLKPLKHEVTMANQILHKIQKMLVADICHFIIYKINSIPCVFSLKMFLLERNIFKILLNKWIKLEFLETSKVLESVSLTQHQISLSKQHPVKGTSFINLFTVLFTSHATFSNSSLFFYYPHLLDLDRTL